MTVERLYVIAGLLLGLAWTVAWMWAADSRRLKDE